MPSGQPLAACLTKVTCHILHVHTVCIYIDAYIDYKLVLSETIEQAYRSLLADS
jgi:hypothetical protein